MHSVKKINYKSIFKAFIPIGIILFLVLRSELRTEGSFGGIVTYFKYLFFLIFGIALFVYTVVKQVKKIIKKSELKEAVIVLSLLIVSTLVAVSSFWFPKDFFDKESKFIATDNLGTELKLSIDGKYMLRTYDYEWTTIDRGNYQLTDSIIILEEKVKEKKWAKELGNI